MSVTNKIKNHGLPWPPEFVTHQSNVETEWKIRSMNLHKELAGKSGAFVYLVNIDSDSFNGFAILKFEKRESCADLPTEPERLELARSNSKEFANQHLPSLLHDFCHDSVIISLFSITENGLEYVQPLAILDAEADKNILYVAEKLVEWNSIKHVSTQNPVTPNQLLSNWLGYRIDRSNGGRLHDFMELYGVNECDAGLSAAGTVYPNPLNFCLENSFGSDIYPVLGQQHGDCHGKNILLRKEHEKADPHLYLIDFALYQASWPIFYDHAYLELSLLLEYVTLFEVRRWDAFLTYCGKRVSDADKTLLQPADNSYANIVRSIRNAQETWSEKNYKSLRSSLDSQQILARVAVGLNFANKTGLQEHLRYMSLIYAAHQLKEYFRLKNISLPDHGKPLIKPTNTHQVEVGDGIEDWQEIWQQFSEFRTDHVFALVVGKELSQNTEHLATLGRLPWSMVMDFDPDSHGSGLMAAAKAELIKRRGFHSLTPEQAIDVNFDQGTLWLMVRGSNDRPDTLVKDFNGWRYGKIPAIGTHLNNLRKQTSPRQLRVLFMFTKEDERKYFEAIAERVQEVFYEGNPKLILCRASNLPIIGEEDTFISVNCKARQFDGRVDTPFGYVCRR